MEIVRLSGDPLIQDSLNRYEGRLSVKGDSSATQLRSLTGHLAPHSLVRPGDPDGQTITFGRTPGLRRYKIEDFALCPDGTLLGMEGKLGNTNMDISSFVTNLV